MAIITISRTSYSQGREIAERVAERLGYALVAREVILRAAGRLDVPEIELARAMLDAPSLLERFGSSKETYRAQFAVELLRRATEDDVVYHGHAGHFFLPAISHVLKVRLIADMEDRIRQQTERESISRGQARSILEKDDEERRRWSRDLYGIDASDPILHHLVIHVGPLTTTAATDIICDLARRPDFRATPASRQALQDLLLAAEVRARLVVDDPLVEVSARDGVVSVKTRGPKLRESSLRREIERRVRAIDGVREVKVEVSGQARFA